MGRIGVLAFDGKGWKGEQLSRQTHRQRLWEDDRRSHTPKEDSVIGVLLRNIVSLSMVDLIPILLALLTPPGVPSGSVVLSGSHQCRRCGFHSWARKIPWRRKQQPTPVFLPGESHGQRSLGATVHGVTKSGT